MKDFVFQAKSPVLAGIDAFSTYCYLLTGVEHRDEDTWGYHLLEASEQGLNPFNYLSQWEEKLKKLSDKGVDCEAWEKKIDDRVAALYGL